MSSSPNSKTPTWPRSDAAAASSASRWASPDAIPTPFACSGDKQPTNQPSPPFSHNFRKVVAAYAESLIALDGRVIEPQMMRWCATALAAHLLDGMSAWLDDGDPSLDDNYIVLQVCGLFAMIDAWGDPHPPEWITPETTTAP